VVGDDRAVWRPLRLGRRGGGFAEVVEGVAPGETVVGWPGERVQAGQRLKPRENAP
jgi:multidrug efflux pump subunit AcrA (membrane-fusion protein)